MACAHYTFSCMLHEHVKKAVELNNVAKRSDNRELTNVDLQLLKSEFDKAGAKAMLYELKRLPEEPNAMVLHVPATNNKEADNALQEIQRLGDNMDKQCIDSYNRIWHKGVWSFAVGDRHQEADIENGLGMLYDFEEMPAAKMVRKALSALGKGLNLPLSELFASAKVFKRVYGVAYHGKMFEKNPRIGLHLGAAMQLSFLSFTGEKVHGSEFRIRISHGDLYFLSEEAQCKQWLRDDQTGFRFSYGRSDYLNKQFEYCKQRTPRKRKRPPKRKRLHSHLGPPELLCHRCKKYQRELRLIMQDERGNQYCWKCDKIVNPNMYN